MSHAELLHSFGHLPEQYVTLNVATTGLFDDAGAPGCIAIGVAFVDDGACVDGQEFKVKPHRTLSSEVAQINGYDPAEVMAHPSFSSQWEQLAPWLENQLVVIHSAAFHWRVIIDHIERYKLRTSYIKGVFCSQVNSFLWAEMNQMPVGKYGPSLLALSKSLSVDWLNALNQDGPDMEISARQTSAVTEALRNEYEACLDAPHNSLYISPTQPIAVAKF